MRIKLLALLAPLLFGGCAAVGTFSQQTQDLGSGASDQRVQAAEVHEQQASAYNASLQLQLGAVEARRANLEQQVDDADGQLHRVRVRLASSGAASSLQRDDYHRLLSEQQTLKAKLRTMAAHPATTPEDAGAQRVQLEELTRQKDELKHEIDGLQAGLDT